MKLRKDAGYFGMSMSDYLRNLIKIGYEAVKEARYKKRIDNRWM